MKCCKILNNGPTKLKWTPNDRKFNADSKNHLRSPRKTIFRRTFEKHDQYLLIIRGRGKNLLSSKPSQLKFFWCSFIWITIIRRNFSISCIFGHSPDKKLAGARFFKKRWFFLTPASFLSGECPKMHEIEKFLRIIVIHIKLHQKNFSWLSFEDST